MDETCELEGDDDVDYGALLDLLTEPGDVDDLLEVDVMTDE